MKNLPVVARAVITIALSEMLEKMHNIFQLSVARRHNNIQKQKAIAENDASP